MEKPGNSHSSWDLAPRTAGRRPHLRLSLLLAAPVLAIACATTGGNQVTQPSVLGMTDKMPPYYSDGLITLYQVQVPVHMPMRAPNAAEASALGPADPFPRHPFIAVDDVKSEIRYTLTNLDTTKHTVELLIDPWNEFVRYKPGIQIVSDEQTTPDLSGRDKLIVLDPMQRIQGTFTSDDIREVAIDLATVQEIQACYIAMSGCTSTATIDPKMANLNGMFNHAFNVQNNSTGYDPLLAPYRTKVVPAMIGFDLGMRSDAPENIAVEVQVDVTDVSSAGNKVVAPGSSDPAMPMPTTILAPPKVKAM